MADRIGRRAVFVGGLVIFTACSAACAAASSAVVLDIARGAQGVGVAYIVAGFLAHPDWGAAAEGLVVPSMPLNRDAVLVAVATVGTTLAPWGLAFIQSYAVEKRLRVKDLRFERIDVVVGAVLTGVIGLFAVVAIAAAIVLIPDAPLIPVLFLTQALNAVLLLVILPFIRSLAKDGELNGRARIGGVEPMDHRHHFRPDRGLGADAGGRRPDVIHAQTPSAKLRPSMIAAPAARPVLGPSGRELA